MLLRLLSLSCVFLATAPLAFADFITGHVVDSNGNPVPGVNINAFRVSNGNEETLANDGTNGNGDFLTTIPPNVYDLHFQPPAPPASTLVTLVLHNVVVVGTVNLGTLVLPPGVLLSGHIQAQNGTPLGQVTLNVIDQLTNEPVIQAQHKSDAFGNFNLSVPAHAVELQLDATGLLIGTYASRALQLSPAANTNLGNIILPPGFTVSGTVVRTVGGTTVNAVDLDFFDTTTGEKLYTPNDNSNAVGAFSVVVPAGNFDIEFCPVFATRLVGKRINRTVAGNLVVGNVALDPGFVLTGTVRSFDSTIQVNSDLDVRDMDAGIKVVTCADNTNGSGVYQIIVPGSRLKVIFHPPSASLPLGNDIHKNLVISADTVLNGTLPSCPLPNNYGTGLAGTGGIVPHLTTSGGASVADNGAFALELQNGRGGAQAFLLVSLATDSRTFFGGTLLANPSLGALVPLSLGGVPGAAGAGSLQLPFNLAPVVNANLYAQFFVRDVNAVQGWAFSEGLHFRVCR